MNPVKLITRQESEGGIVLSPDLGPGIPGSKKAFYFYPIFI
jgi:hypothetical protein